MKTGFTFETKLLIHMVDNTQIYAKWHKHAFSKVKKTKDFSVHRVLSQFVVIGYT